MGLRIRERRDERQKRRVVVERARELARQNPNAKPDEIMAAVREELSEDYPEEFGERSGFDWMSFLPIFLELIKMFFSKS